MKTVAKKNRKTLSNKVQLQKYLEPVSNNLLNGHDLKVSFSDQTIERMKKEGLIDFEILTIEKLKDDFWFASYNKKEEKHFRIGDNLILKKTATITEGDIIIFQRHLGDGGLRLGLVKSINGFEVILDTPYDVVECRSTHFAKLFKVWGKVEIERF